MRWLWLASTHPLEYRVRSTTSLAALSPREGESPKFAQIYFIDEQESEIATRCAIVDGLKPDIVRGINQLLHENNHYVEVFKVTKEIFEQEDNPTNVKIVINETKRPSGEHSRRYNSPLSNEIGVLMPNDANINRDIVLHYRDGSLNTFQNYIGVMTHCSTLYFSHKVLMAGMLT